MSWQETTLRKGTKTPKICRDMFITDTIGEWKLCEVKNGRMSESRVIDQDEAASLITKNKLVPCATIFSSCFTYRTRESVKLINDILSKL